jgi:predicted CoA-binding protein
MIPVNPGAAGTEILGEMTYSSLADIPSEIEIDMVDVFRAPSAAPEIARQAVERGAKVLWTQLGVVSDDAAEIAHAGGLVRSPHLPHLRPSQHCRSVSSPNRKNGRLW